jgi:hypothetical protein
VTSGPPEREGRPGPWRRKDATRVAALVALILWGCRPPLVAATPRVSLRMTGTPADATVIIDEEKVGSLDLVAAHGVALPVGVHHVTVEARGYFTWDREVFAVEGKTPIRFEVALTRVPD